MTLAVPVAMPVVSCHVTLGANGWGLQRTRSSDSSFFSESSEFELGNRSAAGAQPIELPSRPSGEP